MRQGLERLDLLLQAVDIDRELLPQARRGGRLPVRACQHSHVGPLLCVELQLIDQPTQLGQIDVLYRLSDHQREGGVIDILRGEPEVDELLLIGKPEGIEPLLDEVLHGLDVVVRRTLDLLDTCCISAGEAQVDVVEVLDTLFVEHLAECGELLAQGDEVKDLDTYPIAD